MMNKIVIVAVLAFVAAVNGGVVPAAYAISPYASTYNAHTINHAVAAPFVAAPSARIVSSPFVGASPYVASSPYVAAASPYVASPFAASPFAASPYSLPYSSPYSFSPYSYPNYYL